MAFKFASYETLGSIYYRAVGKARAEANRIDDLIVGGAAGSIAAALTTPVDVIKTRMMCDAASRPTIFSAARAVAAEGRIGAWFAGVGPRSLSSGINSAVFFMFLESLRASRRWRRPPACPPASPPRERWVRSSIPQTWEQLRYLPASEQDDSELSACAGCGRVWLLAWPLHPRGPFRHPSVLRRKRALHCDMDMLRILIR